MRLGRGDHNMIITSWFCRLSGSKQTHFYVLAVLLFVFYLLVHQIHLDDDHLSKTYNYPSPENYNIDVNKIMISEQKSAHQDVQWNE